jgi:hypothetical protein
MVSKSSLPKSLNIQSNAPSGHVPSILQLSLWDLLAEATRVPLDAQLWMLFKDLDGAIDGLPIDQQIFVAGEGLARVGEIVGLRAELHLQEINYLLHPEQEPVMALDVFDRYVRQSMVVDLDQFCEAPELPEVGRGYVRSVVEPMSEEEVRAVVVAAIHDEDIGGWSARIGDCLMACGGSMGFWSIVKVTGLKPIEVWLRLLLGSGCSIKRRGVGGDDKKFYERDGILIAGINRTPRKAQCVRLE